MNLIIRSATADDAAAMIDFVHALTLETDIDIVLGPGEFTMAVEEERRFLAAMDDSDNSIMILAEVDGELVGQLGLTGGKRRAVHHTAYLGMSVKKGWRNCGIGRALLAYALDWARAGGVIRRIELNVFARNARAIHLYESFGFQVEGRRRKIIFLEGQYLDDLVMAWLVDETGPEAG